MRITGGSLRGRRLRVPRGGVRPTQDRVRAALFSKLGARVGGCRFLDLYAGTGAVGIEAWSRGASFVCWVESSRRGLPVLRENVRRLCGSAGEVVGCRVARFLARRAQREPFGIVYCDPPYGLLAGAGRLDLPGAVAGAGVLEPEGLLVLEMRRNEPFAATGAWRVTDDACYGDTRLYLLRRDPLWQQIVRE